MPIVEWNSDDEKDQEDNSNKKKIEEANNELIQKIKDAAASVMNELGVGFSESVYHSALETEFRERNMHYEHEPIINVLYKNSVVGFLRPDLVLNKKIIVELKAFGTKSNGFFQLKRYLKCSDIYNVGILINFCMKPVTIQVLYK